MSRGPFTFLEGTAQFKGISYRSEHLLAHFLAPITVYSLRN